MISPAFVAAVRDPSTDAAGDPPLGCVSRSVCGGSESGTARTAYMHDEHGAARPYHAADARSHLPEPDDRMGASVCEPLARGTGQALDGAT
jgi:hypothetical protein